MDTDKQAGAGERSAQPDGSVPEKWNPKEYAPHQRVDVYRRNENIDAGRPLCSLCEGTGNMFLSMYKKCDACAGSGVAPNTLASPGATSPRGDVQSEAIVRCIFIRFGLLAIGAPSMPLLWLIGLWRGYTWSEWCDSWRYSWMRSNLPNKKDQTQ